MQRRSRQKSLLGPHCFSTISLKHSVKCVCAAVVLITRMWNQHIVYSEAFKTWKFKFTCVVWEITTVVLTVEACFFFLHLFPLFLYSLTHDSQDDCKTLYFLKTCGIFKQTYLHTKMLLWCSKRSLYTLKWRM